MDSEETYMESCQVILFGYNRPDLLEDRLNELMKIQPSNLLVSIDWFSPELTKTFSKLLNDFSISWPANCNFEYKLHGSNQGLAMHLTETIKMALEKSKAVIVIEDDVSISSDFIRNASETLLRDDFHERNSSIGGFSVFQFPKFLTRFNFFRNTIYFQCWGWGTTREVWNRYRLDLTGIDIEAELSNSKSWNKLSRVQRETWLGRLSKIQCKPIHTWDIQFQYLTFLLDKKQILPVGRLTDNLGFGDKRSEHTKNARPWWLGRPGYNAMPRNNHLNIYWFDSLLEKIESLSLIGDSHSALPFVKVFIGLIKFPAKFISLAVRR